MGYQNGLVAHYWSGDRDDCHTFLITDDHGPNYGALVSGVLVEPGATDGAPATLTTKLDVQRDGHQRGPKETDTVKLTAGSWHLPSECPERFNVENRDRRPGRPPTGAQPEPDRPPRPPRDRS